ncbi:MAG: putative Ig domain-containing protein [Planctomycetales bacterium]
MFATDSDGDPLEFSLVSGPAGLTISPDGFVAWEPTAAQFGENALRVRVSDGQAADEREFQIDVRSQLRNGAPRLTDAGTALAVAGKLFAADLIAADADGDPVAFELLSGPAGLSVDPARGTVRWVPAFDQLGAQSYRVRAFDPFGGFDEKTYTIQVRGIGGPPAITSIPPTEAVVGQTYIYAVAAVDVDGDPLTYALQNSPAGMLIDATTGVVTWTPQAHQVGAQPVIVRVADGTGGFATQAFSIAVSAGAINRPPVMHSTPPVDAVVGTSFVYSLQATDPEGSAVTYAKRSGPAGLTVDPATGVVHWIPTAGEIGRLVLVLTATDPGGAAAVQSLEVDVQATNNGPQINSTAPSSVPAGGLYRYDLLAEDPDHEPLSYELVSGPAGMTIDSVGHVRWQTTPNTSLGDRQASVIVRDGRGGSVSQSFTVTVRADTTAPRVAIIISNPILYPWSTDPARVRVSASDDVGVAVLAVTVDGEPVALGPDGAFTVFFSAPGGGRIEAAATDAAGNRGRNVAQVSMRSGTEVGGDFTPNGPPQVAITSQADGDQVRGLVQVIGSATSPDLTDYTLSYRRAGETNSHEISRGTGQVNNALLGQWDTSQLENDEYIVRLEASDLYGNFSAVERRVGVSGALKMGNFRLTFADLTIPVAGIPITVARSYDTLRAGRSGEFGYGWQLEFRNVDLRTSVGRSGLEDTGVYAPYSVGARVYITLPGGERQGFTFTPDLRVLRGFGQGNNLTIATPRFTPDLGVTSQLSVRGGNLLVNDFDELYATGGIPWNPASPDFGGGFTLTTADGTRYFIDGNSGELQTVFDRNGNTLTFSDRGIVSSTGVQVAFERDAQGRIVTVIDPAGKAIRYSYTATGDLGSVTDQDRHTTQFQYRTTPPHFMERVIDPLGRTGMRVDYGPDGRLNQVSDANGQTSHIDYDLNGRQQSLTDSLGNLTLIQYDLRGNVVAQIDPLGGVTRHAYDQNDREVSLTDPLGRTTSWTYDAAGNVLTITDPLGRVTRQTFNEFGQGLSIIDPLGRATRTTYDARGNAVRIVGADGLAIDLENDPAGNLTALVGAGGRRGTLAYDANGRLVNMADPRGEVTSQRYDSNGRLIGHTTVMSPGGTQSTRSTTFELSASGRLLSTTDSAGGVTRYQYDVQGNRTVQVDALNHATSQEFDLTNRLVKTVDPDGLATQLSYDALGRLAATTDRGGHTTKFAFDPLGRIVETILPDATPGTDLDNPRTHTEFDLVGQTTATIDPLGRRTEYAYDLVGRVTRVRNAAGGETHYEYDAADRLVAITDPMGATTRFVYDLGDRLVETQFADGRTTKNQYDERRRRIVSTDAAGVSTRFEYDAFDRLIAVQDALGGRTLYTYNAEGQLIRQTDANGHATQYAYDRLGRLVQTTLPLGQVSTADYDLANRVVRSQDLNGQVTTADFDSMGHLATQRFADGTTIEFAYTPSGQISRTTDSLGVTEFSYDERDRLILKTNPDGQKIGYAYDAVGNRTAMTTAAGTTHYAYDTLNRLVSVTATDGSVTAYEYDAAGRLLRATTPDGVVETRQYDLRGRVMELDSRLAGGAQLAHYSYRRDPTGRIVQVQESSGRTVDYVYDATYRLVRETILETGHGPRTISYSYDAVGNRLARNDSAAGTTLYFYDANDRLLRENGPAGETRFVYDAQGNLLSRTGPLGDTTNYRWNVRQQLVEVVSTTGGATHTTAFRYDADGLRVAQIVDGVETRLLLDLSQANPTVVLEYAPSGVVLRETVFGLGPISEARGGGTAYFHLDAHSGIRKVVDAAGQVQQTFAYDAFGRLLASTGLAGDALLYRGEMRSQSTGLDYLRTRWLDTETGRFLSRDPFAGTLLNPLSLNDYLYASADPINNSDPSGLSPYSEQLVSLAVRGILLSIPAALVLTPVINYTTTGNASWDGLGNNLLVGMSIGGLVAISPLAGIVSATIGVLGASATATSVITDPNASPLRKILAGALVVGAGLGAAKARGRYIESPTLLNPKFSGKKLLIVGTPKQNSEVVPEWQKNHAFSIDRTPPEQITDGVFANLQGRDINDLNLVNLFGRTIRQIQLPNIPFADPAEAGAAGVNGKLLAQQATRLGAQLVYGVVGGLSKGTVNFLEELQIRGWAIQVILQENNSYIFTAQR